MKSKEPFTPWKEHYWASDCLFIISAVSLAAGISWLILNPSPWAWVFIVFGLPLAIFTLIADSRGLRREQGVVKEHAAIERLKKVLPKEWKLEEDLELYGIGNLDLLITLTYKKKCVIEIKHWTRLLERLVSKATRQVRRQSKAVAGDYRIIWLPEYKRGLLEYAKGINLILGNEMLLLERLHFLDEEKYTVKFPMKPSSSLLTSLKSLGYGHKRKFYYEIKKGYWQGYVPAYQMERLRKDIEKQNGSITYEKSRKSKSAR